MRARAPAALVIMTLVYTWLHSGHDHDDVAGREAGGRWLRSRKAACRAPGAAPGKRPMGGFSVGWAGGEGHRGGVGLAGLVRPADADLVAGVVLPQHRLDVRGGRDGV